MAKQVAGVGIGVEKPMFQELSQRALHPHLNQAGGINALVGQGRPNSSA
jgi:hypothetical protein